MPSVPQQEDYEGEPSMSQHIVYGDTPGDARSKCLNLGDVTEDGKMVTSVALTPMAGLGAYVVEYEFHEEPQCDQFGRVYSK